MKKSIFASVGSVLLALLSPAFAADMPLKGPPAYMAPYYNWSGFYIGINGGYAFGQSSWSIAAPPVSTGNFNMSGGVVGGTLGYNYQMGAIVWGLEGDFDWAGIKGSTTTLCAGGCTTKDTWLGTGRLRLGYAFDRWLPFVTGGAAFGDIQASNPAGATSKVTNVGWTAGAGIEWAFLANWTAKVEYLYVDLGKGKCNAACSAVPIDVKFQTSLVRAGINYRF